MSEENEQQYNRWKKIVCRLLWLSFVLFVVGSYCLIEYDNYIFIYGFGICVCVVMAAFVPIAKYIVYSSSDSSRVSPDLVPENNQREEEVELLYSEEEQKRFVEEAYEKEKEFLASHTLEEIPEEVDERDEEPDADLVILQWFVYRREAEVAKGYLYGNGIESMISADDAGGYRPDLSLGKVCLLVNENDYEMAKKILAE